MTRLFVKLLVISLVTACSSVKYSYREFRDFVPYDGDETLVFTSDEGNLTDSFALEDYSYYESNEEKRLVLKCAMFDSSIAEWKHSFLCYWVQDSSGQTIMGLNLMSFHFGDSHFFGAEMPIDSLKNLGFGTWSDVSAIRPNLGMTMENCIDKVYWSRKSGLVGYRTLNNGRLTTWKLKQ